MSSESASASWNAVRAAEYRPSSSSARPKLLSEAAKDPLLAEAEVRFKLVLPERVIHTGRVGVGRLARETVASYERILGSDALARCLPPD